MTLDLSEVDPESDFPAVAKCLVESYESPPQPLVYVHLADLDKGRGKLLEELSTRLALWQMHMSNSVWQKVVDTTTGEIVGAANWLIYPDNPFAQQVDFDVSWFADEGAKRFVKKVLELKFAPRVKIGQRPQVYLANIFTHPKYRHRGVAQQLMAWGVAKADEMGVEMFLDAGSVGRPLYEHNGFVAVKDNDVIPKADGEVDEAWDKLAARVGQATIHLMWRPVGGPYEEGKTVFPWSSA